MHCKSLPRHALRLSRVAWPNGKWRSLNSILRKPPVSMHGFSRKPPLIRWGWILDGRCIEHWKDEIMRLTLRNLLAYMDDLLDPESARIIGRKIEESEFASGLLHRIRDVTRRTKLGAPEVIDRKAALDPNTVAEYLDNILPSDRVTDFEKACLDSDVELAEVAACHQILTLVLGEPAEVRPESRVRMYHLPETAASHTYVEGDGTDTDRENLRVDTPAPSGRQRRQPAVPEYLLEARRRRRRLYGFATVAAVLCVVAYLGATGGLSGFFGSAQQPSPLDDQIAVNMPVKPQLPAESSDIPVPPAPASEPTSETPQVQEPPTAPPESVAALAVSPPAVEPSPVPPDDAMTTPDATTESQPAPESIVTVTPTPSPTENAASEIPVPVTPLESPAPTPDPGQIASMVPSISPDNREPMVAEPMVPETVQGREIGRFIKPEELALMADGEGTPFYRITNTEPLRTGQRVVSLPVSRSRPMFLLDGSLIVEMVGGGELHLLPSEEGDPLHIELVSGRMLLAPSDEAGTVKVLITAGGVTGLLSLADSTTGVALEVGRADGPIQDPLTHPAPATARLWGMNGRFSWQASGEAEVALENNMMLDLVAGAGSAPVPVDAPAWVQADALGALDQKLGQRAYGLLKKAFDFDKPLRDDDQPKEADLILHENVDHRLKEMRRLARQSLSWIEDFDLIVEVLNNRDRYAEWPEVIDLLRESVRRSPRTAQAVQKAMTVKYGNRGEELYELLWKYDDREISSEDAKKLVQYLSDELPYRVLSFNNLNRITGLGFYYRADESELERKASVQRWIAWADRFPGPGAPTPTDTTPK